MKQSQPHSKIVWSTPSVNPRMRFLVAAFCILGLTSAFPGISIDGNFDDWEGGASSTVASVEDDADLPDTSGDIRRIEAFVKDGSLHLGMTVEGIVAPTVDETPVDGTNRYYYHWLLDTDNNPATGVSNSEYEGNPTNIAAPIGAEYFVQVGWRNGAPDGVMVYEPQNNDNEVVTDFQWTKDGASMEAVIPLAELGLTEGQTIALSAFQEGASDGWMVDWMESTEVLLEESSSGSETAAVEDPADLPDTSGDIRRIEAFVKDGSLHLGMTVEGIIAPTVEETPADGTNRYYYHWLLDTDNNPATGVSNSEYEGNPTNIEAPIGAEYFVQVGWRNGAPDGVMVYEPQNNDNEVVTDFAWTKDGASMEAVIPLAELGLTEGQTIALSAFQEGASDGWMVDWMESTEVLLEEASSVSETAAVEDPADLPDTSGDIRSIEAFVKDGSLHLGMTVEGIVAPTVEETPADGTNRYYYHWLLDTDNNPATGVSNSEYEGNPTGIEVPIGAEYFVQVGWRNGAPDGVMVYEPQNNDNEVVTDFQWTKDGASMEAIIPLAELGLSEGQTIALSAFQEGASDGWMVDWMESTEVVLEESSAGTGIPSVEDDSDHGDSSGDLKLIQVTADNEHLYLRMSVHGIIVPTVDETPVDATNRYYYHWLLDIDNNPATGVSNAEYEGNQTGVETPIGAEIFVQVGWRDGAPDGVMAYEPQNNDNELVTDFEWQAGGDSIEAKILLADLGLTPGQEIGLSAFQEGQSNGWAVDWMESTTAALVPPDSGRVNLTTEFAADPYGFRIELQNSGGQVLDPNSIKVLLDGTEATSEATTEGGVTTVRGVHATWLPGGGAHALAIEYQTEGSATVHSRQFPFKTPEYSVFTGSFANSGVNVEESGFVANVTQISELQANTVSLHNNIATRAELQLAGEFLDEQGAPYYNEVTGVKDRWELAQTNIEGTINWHELAPDPTGHFSDVTGFEDQPIPQLDGDIGNGLVIEILTFLELKAGFHQFGVNTTGGYKFTAGPDGRDKLSPIFGAYDGSRNYSYEADHYFNILAEQDGFYPVRLLWFHSAKTKEDAQLEFYSIADQRRILVNDPADPLSTKAYRVSATPMTYVSSLTPSAGEIYATPDSEIEIQITGAVTDGSIQVLYDGVEVSPVVTVNGDITTVAYTPPAAEWGSEHTVTLSYGSAGPPPMTRSGTFSYSLYSHALELPSDWAGTEGSGQDPGFSVRTVQSIEARDNSVSAAESQLAGAGDFSASGTAELVNFNLFEGEDIGVFFDDIGLTENELIDPGLTENFSMEIITYLELPAGAYTFGINSDDGFLLTAGATPVDKALEFDRFEGGRGTSTMPQNLFDVVVPKSGVYPFRMLWYQGTGGASAEWYSYDRQNAVATLINSEGGIKAFQTLLDPNGNQIIAINVAENRDVTITWLSKATSTYSLEVSPNLQDWVELDDGIDGEPETTSFIDTNIPDDTRERFYRVIQQ
jgi:hypothetical protein